MTRKERVILFLLAGLNFTHFLDFMIMVPLNNYLTPYFGISARQFSYLVSAYAVSAAVSGFITAFIVDGFDRKKTLLVSYVGFLAGTIACGFADSYYFLLVTRTIAGFFGGIIGAQILAIIADFFSYERRAKAMSSVSASFAIASILGVPLSLYLSNLFNNNWHVPFLFVGCIGIVMLPFVIRYVPSMKEHINQKNKKPLDLLRSIILSPLQRSALIFSCLLMIGHFLIIPFITPYMEFNKGYSKDQIPVIYLAGGLASLAAAFFLGRLADAKGKLFVFTISVFLSAMMVLLLTQMPAVAFIWVLVSFAIWFALATGRALTAQAMMSEVVKAEQRGSFMSFNGCVQQVGTGVASVLAGLIVYNDEANRIYRYEWLGYLSVAVLLIALVMGRYLFADLDKKKDR